MKLLALMDKVLAGQIVWTKNGGWYISLKEGKLAASSFPQFDGRVYTNKYPTSSFGMEHDDWEVFVPPPPQLYVKDLKKGDKFVFDAEHHRDYFIVVQSVRDREMFYLDKGNNLSRHSSEDKSRKIFLIK